MPQGEEEDEHPADIHRALVLLLGEGKVPKSIQLFGCGGTDFKDSGGKEPEGLAGEDYTIGYYVQWAWHEEESDTGQERRAWE